jgi:hypothetical protein
VGVELVIDKPDEVAVAEVSHKIGLTFEVLDSLLVVHQALLYGNFRTE